MGKPKSRSRRGHLATVFPFDPDDKDRTDMYGWMAVLCVLSQDLSLEISTIYDQDFSKRVDQHIKGRVVQDFSDDVRKIYFLRRAIASLREFGVAVGALDKNSTFRKLRASFRADRQIAWEESVGYFKSSQKFLRGIRNDVGGHFSLGAAREAMKTLWHQERGELQTNPGEEVLAPQDSSIEECQSRDLRGPLTHPWKLHFAPEIGAGGLLKHGTGKSPYDQMSDVVAKVLDAMKHAHQAVDVILREHLWNRFTK